jgi:hypothetical protein
MWLDAPAGAEKEGRAKGDAMRWPSLRATAGFRQVAGAIYHEECPLLESEQGGPPEFDFRRHLRRAAQLFPQRRYGVSFQKVSGKRISVKKMDDAGRKITIALRRNVAVFLPCGRTSDTELGKACGRRHPPIVQTRRLRQGADARR